MTLYLLCGMSFSGKSTLAEAIAQQAGAVVVGLDSINAERGLFGGFGIPDREWAASHDVALQRVEDALADGHSVVVDDTNGFRFLRDGYRSVSSASASLRSCCTSMGRSIHSGNGWPRTRAR